MVFYDQLTDNSRDRLQTQLSTFSSDKGLRPEWTTYRSPFKERKRLEVKGVDFLLPPPDIEELRRKIEKLKD